MKWTSSGYALYHQVTIIAAGVVLRHSADDLIAKLQVQLLSGAIGGTNLEADG